MGSDKNQEHYQTYKPEHPVDEATRKQEQEEIRAAARHAAQQAASEELGDKETGTRQQAEKEIHEAANKVKKAKPAKKR